MISEGNLMEALRQTVEKTLKKLRKSEKKNWGSLEEIKVEPEGNLKETLKKRERSLMKN